jgi:hypothetical protein
MIRDAKIVATAAAIINFSSYDKRNNEIQLLLLAIIIRDI